MMDVDSEDTCFFAKTNEKVSCNQERISLQCLLEPSNDLPVDCASELEHLLLLAGFYDLKPTNLYHYTICSNHQKALLSLRHRRHTCQLCVDVFHKAKRSTASLQRVTKALAIRVWILHRINTYNLWTCTRCRKAVAASIELSEEAEEPFKWLYDEFTIHTPTTAASAFSRHDSDYEPAHDDVPMSPNIQGKKEFKEWLASTDYKGRWRSTDNYLSLSNHDQRVFRNQMKEIFHHILDHMAPNVGDSVWNDIIGDELEKPTKTKAGDYGVVMNSLKDAYYRAEHWSTQRQLLSIVAGDLPKHLLKAEFPELTDGKIKAARSLAYFQGRGTLPQISHSSAQRYTERQLAHFIDFVQSPHIITDMPFGERTIKLSSGQKITVPDVIRNIIPSRIVAQYLAYCEEAGETKGFKPLASSTLFAILSKCSASTRKSLAGLDNFSCDGSTAFDRLRDLCDEMATYGAKPETIVRLKQQLHDHRNYLKLDFKTHVSQKNRVGDHCSTFALSDPDNPSWREKCDHDHDEECTACLALYESLQCLRSLIEDNTDIDGDTRRRLVYRLNHNSQLIDDWKKHLLRTVHQDFARKQVLELLDNKSVFLVADWAMKWLPTRYRESQRDFFGKRGLPWHVTYAIRLSPKSSSNSSSSGTPLLEHQTFCHVFDNAKQDGPTVASILSNVLMELKQADNNLTTAYIRTDNAGCYKGSDTLLAVNQIYKLTGVFIRRFDFSDAQSGKGPCDRMAAVIKANVRRFINEKNDCITSSDFVNAAKSTQYTTVRACRLAQPPVPMKKRWSGVQSFNNIEYELVSNRDNNRRRTTGEEIRVTVRRAFGIGAGKTSMWSHLNVSSSDIVRIETSIRYDNQKWHKDTAEDDDPTMSETMNTTLVDKEPMDIDENEQTEKRPSGFITFDCPEPCCTMQFRREDRLRAHLLVGSHRFIDHSYSLLDKAALMYKDALESDRPRQVPLLPVANTTTRPLAPLKNNLKEGWALFSPRKKILFTPVQRAYLNQKYDEGEASGAKWDPAAVAQHMETAKKNGRFMFEPEQFLTASQIKSYFSRITRERRTDSNNSQTAPYASQSFDGDEEDERSQEDEDNQDFDAANASFEAYTLLNQAIRTTDDILTSNTYEQ